MGKESLIRSYYYDYHKLKISLETSKIMLESHRLELDELLTNDKKNYSLITNTRKKIEVRLKLIGIQENLLKQMENVIHTFPTLLKKPEDDVYELLVINGYTESDIAVKLGYCKEHIRKISSRILDKFNNYLKTVE